MNRSLTLLTVAATCHLVATLAFSDDSTLRSERPCEIAILSDHTAGQGDQWIRSLANQLRKDALHVTELSAAQACDGNELSADRFFLYIIPNCRTYPAAGLEALSAYAQHRGHILFLGGPFLDDPIWQGEEGWLHREQVSAIKQNAQPTHSPFPRGGLSADQWRRTTNDQNAAGAWETVAEGPDGTPCFRFTTENLTGWDGYLSPNVTQLFGPQHDLFTFMAKGSPRTTQVAVELQEQDGSRWIAVASIGVQWQRVTLEPRDFTYWPDSNTRGRRGGAGDRLQPGQACRVNFQLAQSHTTAVPPGEHAFWIADVGTCMNPVAGMHPVNNAANTSLETIFPRYKVYSLQDPTRVRSISHPVQLAGFDMKAASDSVCGIPRTMGRGFQRNQKWRYIPLAEATDASNHQRGFPAWLVLNQAEPYAGSVFACVGLNDPAQLSSHAPHQLVSQLALRLRAGLFLQEAGSEHFAYWPGEAIKLGATVVNRGTAPLHSTTRISVTDERGTEILLETNQQELATQATATWQTTATLPATEPQTLHVACDLLVDNRVIDRIEHEITVLETRSPSRDAFLSVQGNDFYVHGKKWYPVGINYWPLYVSGMDDTDYRAGWIDRRFYDPELVEQDLARMVALGINMVSIQSHDPRYYRNLLDFIRRCGRHHIYVNLFCGDASPLTFREMELRQFIRTARLADNPTIMAYDTIWEPGNYVFREDWRARWNRDWEQWVVQQYGSLETAEEDWDFQSPRDDAGHFLAPPDKYFRTDGPWRMMMAAYRRFMDDLMSRKWNQAHRKLRAIDPNHLISFRQGNTLPHDFTFTATGKHIDFICPEGYAIAHSEDGYFAAGFITRYVHFTTGGKPIIWSEFGQSVWDSQTMEPSASRINTVSDYHDLFYRMVLESGANGTVPWWWPGGYRVGERSDFGIMNTDTTPRPAAELVAKYAPQLTAPRDWPQPTTWFEMDRDAHAGGYWHVCFNSGRDAYRQAVAEGQQLGIRTAGTGTTSANTPLVAVGNRPCTGQNPPKYLNAEFNWLQVLSASGEWVEAHNGAKIQVASGKIIKARVSVGNTQEATWLAPTTAIPSIGDVSLVTTPASQLIGQWPLPQQTPYLADADFGEITLSQGITRPVLLELRMRAVQRSGFGEKRTFILDPQLADTQRQ